MTEKNQEKRTVYETDLLQAVSRFEEKTAAIFDMDGLIFDTERLFMEQLAVVMQENGYRLTREIYCRTLGLCGQKLKETMQANYGTGYPFAVISKEAAKRAEIVAQTVGVSIKPQIRELLQHFQEKHLACAVASSTESSTVQARLEMACLLPYFQQIIGGEMAGHSKPEPDIFLLAAKRLGKSPKECIVLEDSENGVRAAAKAGCTVICIPDLQILSDEAKTLADCIVFR